MSELKGKIVYKTLSLSAFLVSSLVQGLQLAKDLPVSLNEKAI